MSTVKAGAQTGSGWFQTGVNTGRPPGGSGALLGLHAGTVFFFFFFLNLIRVLFRTVSTCQDISCPQKQPGNFLLLQTHLDLSEPFILLLDQCSHGRTWKGRSVSLYNLFVSKTVNKSRKDKFVRSLNQSPSPWSQ